MIMDIWYKGILNLLKISEPISEFYEKMISYLRIYVNKYSKQGSGMISSISFTDGIIEIPEDVDQIKKGDQYKFYTFNEIFT